ncbi:MAG: 4Fe-4S dicluster domain-containing protein [Desulfuromonadaceae bacterium]|nr:4Fe-4S dicluster domain-containing protein [Desulfuromonadaceae bacterium]MDD2854530.1 4Fe-4S dicluster domain-containing protein [Desulfuromonadaceae bacterium]
MLTRFISDQNLPDFMQKLRKFGGIEGPLRGEDGGVRFGNLSDGTTPDIHAIRTLLPAKKYLFAPEERLFNYTLQEGYKILLEDISPVTLFALHPCELAGINYLDRLLGGDAPDPHYAARRSQITLIGISCLPDEFCSCHISPSPLQALSDIFMNIVEGGFVVTVYSSRGKEIMEDMKDLAEERELPVPQDARRFFGVSLPLNVMSEIDTGLPEWQKLADRCLGCGACSLCCPTCACFNILEFAGLDGVSSERIRYWDNCLFKSHSMVAGGAVFNKGRAERFIYRYRHKQRGFGPLRGVPSCVGCGRCRAFCPIGLDLRVLTELLERSAV